MNLRNPRTRLRALAVISTGALVASVMTAIGLASPASAAITAGAPVPFVEQLAVNAQTNGNILAPNYYFGTLASEATGRQAVQLIGQGKFVTFTLTAPANAVDFHYSIPDSLDGAGMTAPLGLYVNGVAQTPLTMTSVNSWLYGSNPPSETNTPLVSDPGTSAPHDMYDDVRTMFSSTLPIGATVTLKVDAGDNAPWYTINTADFELVAAPIAQPAGYLNATSSPYNADPSGLVDSTTALQNAVNAASTAGVGLYLPQGLYKVSSPIFVNKVTIEGAGEWYTELTGHEVEFAGQIGNPSTLVNVSNLSMFGNVNTRDDSDGTVHGFNGGFDHSNINHVWIQNEKVGIWVVGPTDSLTIDSVRIQDTTADGVNFHGSVTNSIVENSFERNLQDDGLAIWSSPGADVNNTFNQNTIDTPGIANNVGLYGGTGTTVTNNLLQDTITRGGGIGIGNRFGATSLAGTTTISGNKLVRTGQFDPGWDYNVGAIWFWPLESALTGTVNITNNEIDDSPGEAFQFENSAPPVGTAVATQGVNGNVTSGVTVTNNVVNNVGTYVFQLQSPGSASVSGTTATGVGVSGIFNCNSGFTLTQGAGNSGWSTSSCGLPAKAPLYAFPSTTTFENASTGSATPSQKVTVFNAGAAAATLGTISASSGFTVVNDPSKPCGTTLDLSTPIDANTWCQVDVSFTAPSNGITTGTLTIPSNQTGNPTVLQLVGSTGANNVITPPTVTPTTLAFGSINVGSTTAAQTLTVTNPGASAITITSVAASSGFSQTNTCGTSLGAGASCTVSVKFSPVSGGFTTGSVAITNSGTQTPIGASLTGTGITSTTNLAQGAAITASSSSGGFAPNQANDGNTTTYWESLDGNAFPQTLTVDLGSSLSIGSVVLNLPPPSTWAARTETLSVLGSNDGTNFTTLSASAGRLFDPATGNTVTITLPANTTDRYVQLNITGNTGWPAGQVSEFAVFPGSGGGGGTATLAANPSSLAFGSVNVGSTSATQTVTVTNSGTVAATVSSVAVTGAFSQTNTCGTSIAAGGSCTVTAKFSPTVAGATSGTITVNSNATNSALTVALTGTGQSVGTATLGASPTSLAFGNQTTNTTSGVQTTTITNSGTVAATVSSVSVTGAFSQTNTCGTSIAAGGTCVVSVKFAPTANGAASGTLTVASNATNPSLTVALTGTGVAPGTATLTATPTSLAFGNQTVGSSSAAKTVTMTNTGTASATISAISVSGVYSQTNNCGGSVIAGGSCTVNVTFSPTATGAASGTLTVASNATNPSLTAALTGTGVTAGTATLTASPTSVAFGNQSVGSTSAATNVTITNTGTASATISGVTVSGAFAQTNTCTTIAAGGTCTVSVTFAPTATGAASGTLTVSSNATNPSLTVALTGTGTTATATNLSQGKSVSVSSVSQTYVGTNAVDGDQSTYWESANNTFPQTFTVDLGASDNLTSVVLKLPTTWGARTETLTVSGSTTGTTYTTLVGSAAYTLDPNVGGNSVTINLPAGTVDRFVSLTVTANTGWPAAQFSEVQVMGTPNGPVQTNLALNKATTESGHTQTYASSAVTDGNTSSYWEGAAGFPAFVTVDLGASHAITSVVLNVPPATSWATRTETLSVLGSTDGTNFTTIVGSAVYTFNPATGNTVTITFTSTNARYVKINFTTNSGAASGQLSELAVYGS